MTASTAIQSALQRNPAALIEESPEIAAILRITRETGPENVFTRGL